MPDSKDDADQPLRRTGRFDIRPAAGASMDRKRHHPHIKKNRKMPENNGKIREFWKWSFPRIEVIVSHMKVDVAHIKVIFEKSNFVRISSKLMRDFFEAVSNVLHDVFEHISSSFRTFMIHAFQNSFECLGSSN